MLGVLTALALWTIPTLVSNKSWFMLAYVIVVTIVVDIVFLIPSTRRKYIPLKYIVPGLALLIAFSVVPIIYTTLISFTNYSTGHTIGKSEAIPLILANSLDVAPNGNTYDMRVAVKDGGSSSNVKDLVLLLTTQDAKQTATIGTTTSWKPALKSGGKRDSNGVLVSIPGYTTLTDAQVGNLGNEISNFRVPTVGNAYITPQGTNVAADVAPTLKYIPSKNIMVSLKDGTVYKDNGLGYFENNKVNPPDLLPGWHVNVGFSNYTSLLTDPAIRADFLRVLVWNIVYAFMSVLLTFLMGLGVALALLRPLRGKRVFRSLYILPYAIPSFISTLIWAGLLNYKFGEVNNLLGKIASAFDTFLSWLGIHAHFTFQVPWLLDPTWAKVSILLVNLWLGFPYYFLVCTGALTAIPPDLTEAAAVDGAKPRQIFRKVTMPLLLVAVGPLLVASFSYNFNNFTLIYLLTGGGPVVNPQSVAGATDILISYNYKLAFTAGRGQNFGLSSALSILIFLMIGTISIIAFRRTRLLEDTNR